jgi:hypothetical protein
MFRSLTSSSPRSPAPPSSFPPSLHPDGSRTGSGSEQNRLGVESSARPKTRIDMNFEQALEMGETVVIKEGIDVDSLGGEDFPATPTAAVSSSSSPTLSPSTSSPPHSKTHSPATPPMPPSSSTHHKGSLPSSACRPPPSVSTSASSSSNDLFYDAEDPEYQTRRRSMYRSQGTASSPDLATLVRKAKQRGSILPTQLITKDRRQESAPPLPTGLRAPLDPSPRPRNRSPTSPSKYSLSPIVTSSTTMQRSKVHNSQQSAGPSGGSDWVPTSPSRDDESTKAIVELCLVCETLLTATTEFEIISSAKDARILWQDAGSEHNARTFSTWSFYSFVASDFDASSCRRLTRPQHLGG